MLPKCDIWSNFAAERGVWNGVLHTDWCIRSCLSGSKVSFDMSAIFISHIWHVNSTATPQMYPYGRVESHLLGYRLSGVHSFVEILSALASATPITLYVVKTDRLSLTRESLKWILNMTRGQLDSFDNQSVKWLILKNPKWVSCGFSKWNGAHLTLSTELRSMQQDLIKKIGYRLSSRGSNML